jgi:hypothetical protein
MSTETITIRGVDAQLLDQQRLAFAEYLMQHGPTMPTKVYEHLNGILNMLDAWSDERRVDLPEQYSQWIPKDSKYPKGAVTVVGWEDHKRSIQFAVNGYCEVYKAAVDDFLERFRRVTTQERETEIAPALAYFNLDDTPMILGFTYGDRWNGWGLPFVEKESFRKWLQASDVMGDPEYAHFKFRGEDLVYHHDPCSIEEGEPLEQILEVKQLEFEGNAYDVYDVSQGWCWNQYDRATTDVNDMVDVDGSFPRVFIPKGLEEYHLGFLSLRRRTQYR